MKKKYLLYFCCLFLLTNCDYRRRFFIKKAGKEGAIGCLVYNESQKKCRIFNAREIYYHRKGGVMVDNYIIVPQLLFIENHSDFDYIENDSIFVPEKQYNIREIGVYKYKNEFDYEFNIPIIKFEKKKK